MSSYPAYAVGPLTVGEALVLRDPNRAQARAALKLTLVDLLARRVLLVRHEERRRLLWTKRTSYFTLAPDGAHRAPEGAHIRAVLAMLASACPPHSGATMKEIVLAARTSFGPTLATFQDHYLIGALLGRGLIERRRERVLLIFPTTRYGHTPAGEAALLQLEHQIAQARSIPAYLDRDPAQAAALALALGSTILLADELKPHFAQLSRELRARTSAPYGDSSVVSTGDGSFDYDGCDFDPAAFDVLDSSLDAFDSDFDASDGGDGGGGDGGDGGGDGGGGGGGD